MKALWHIVDNNNIGSFLLAITVAVAGFLALSLLHRVVRSRLGTLAAGTAVKWDDPGRPVSVRIHSWGHHQR